MDDKESDDNNSLVNSKGIRAFRNILQFVRFLEYESNPDRLTQEVLAKIPRQILEYYQQNNLDPIKLNTYNYKYLYFHNCILIINTI